MFEKQDLKSTTRVLTLLEAMAAGAQGSLRDLERQTGIPRSSLSRLLTELEREGWLWKDGEKYVPGTRLFLMGSRLNEPARLVEKAQRPMAQLAASTGKTVLLCRQEGLWGVCLHTREPINPVKFVAHAGMKIPLHCSATGKVLLAWSPEEVQSRVFDQVCKHQGPQAVLDLKKELKTIQEEGYCFSQEEWIPHAADLSAPLFDRRGSFVGQLGLAGLAGTFDRDLPQLLVELQQTSLALGQEL